MGQSVAGRRQWSPKTSDAPGSVLVQFYFAGSPAWLFKWWNPWSRCRPRPWGQRFRQSCRPVHAAQTWPDHWRHNHISSYTYLISSYTSLISSDTSLISNVTILSVVVFPTLYQSGIGRARRHYCTVQYCLVLFFTVQYITIKYCTVQYNTI